MIAKVTGPNGGVIRCSTSLELRAITFDASTLKGKRVQIAFCPANSQEGLFAIKELGKGLEDINEGLNLLQGVNKWSNPGKGRAVRRDDIPDVRESPGLVGS